MCQFRAPKKLKNVRHCLTMRYRISCPLLRPNDCRTVWKLADFKFKFTPTYLGFWRQFSSTDDVTPPDTTQLGGGRAESRRAVWTGCNSALQTAAASSRSATSRCSTDWRRTADSSTSTWPATTYWRRRRSSSSTGHVTAPSDARRKWRHRDAATTSATSCPATGWRRASPSATASDWSVAITAAVRHRNSSAGLVFSAICGYKLKFHDEREKRILEENRIRTEN